MSLRVSKQVPHRVKLMVTWPYRYLFLLLGFLVLFDYDLGIILNDVAQAFLGQ